MSEAKRKKIYLGSRDASEKADDALLVRKLCKAVFEKAVAAQNEGKPIPDSFVHLFGNAATINSSVLRGDAESFSYASEGGAIGNRERLLLNLLSKKMQAKLVSSDSIKESILADIHCIATIDNPVELETK